MDLTFDDAALAALPDGAWKLYTADDALNNAGSIQGWTLSFDCDGKTYSYTGGPNALYDRNTGGRAINIHGYGCVGGLLSPCAQTTPLPPTWI